MTTNNTLRLVLLLLCLAAIITSVTSCSKSMDKPASAAIVAPKAPDYYFSRVRFFKDNRKPATDTTWTLHLTTDALVAQYQKNDGYTYNDTSTFTELGVLWHK